MNMKSTLLFFLVALFATVGIAIEETRNQLPPMSHDVQPFEIHDSVNIDVLDYGLNFAAPLWQKEISRRFPGAVGILCHGGTTVGDVWYASAQSYGKCVPMAELVRHEQAKYPGRTLVLLACNVEHLRLGIPGVYYAKASVWCRPDRAMTEDDYDIGADTDTLDGPLTIPFPLIPFLPGVKPAPKPIDTRTRWEQEPAVVGNIFEFVKDN